MPMAVVCILTAENLLQLVKDWIYILNDSGCSMLFVSTEDIYYKVIKEVVGNCPLLREDKSIL